VGIEFSKEARNVVGFEVANAYQLRDCQVLRSDSH
jgi:hypothetical protein